MKQRQQDLVRESARQVAIGVVSLVVACALIAIAFLGIGLGLLWWTYRDDGQPDTPSTQTPVAPTSDDHGVAPLGPGDVTRTETP